MNLHCMMTVSEHEKAEWARLAQAAYAANRNDLGHQYSVAASLQKGGSISISRFDWLQRGYRGWLIGGFAELDARRAQES
jgi:hypothetical protein